MITQPMTSDRFEAIIEAYGATPSRWPEAERDAARAFMQREPQIARALMAEARGIDALLGSLAAPEPSDALQWEVLARLMPAAVVEKVADEYNVVPFTAPAKPKSRVMWLASGLAAACAAGVIFGVNIGLASTADLRAEDVLVAANYSDVDSW
ncbi:hypothetical protein [Asticcacaulis sp. YBE204]|uniref:hypothetical protein n=1 Tax=Asticcacaulis sp. YBE204 TaxID=1282363 RepID=UPI0003C3FFDA|nr:hypothetical protein [Asticcacaulis sp. YBE204]ESQ81265.1 hypothetical protein AEYBE204_02700 [Asticcacaulis sp. YBE204]